MRFPRSAVWCLAIVTASLWTASAAAQGESGDAAAEGKIDEAVNTHYFQTKFDDAEGTLREALMECGDQCSRPMQAKIWMYLGIVLFNGKQDEAGAKEAFRSARQLDPNVKLDETLTSKETKQLFDQAGPAQPAQAAVAADVQLEPAAPPEPTEEEEDAGPTKPFGSAGQLAVGAERLFGFFSWNYSVAAYVRPIPPPDNIYLDGDHAGSNLALLGNGGGAPYPLGINAFSSPYLALDYFVIDGLSLGGGFAFGTTNLELHTGTLSASALSFRVRGGYALMFSPMFGIWPRAGLTIASQSSSAEVIVNPATAEVATEKWAHMYMDVTVEVPIVFSPVSNVALTLAPLADLGLNGTRTETQEAAGTSVETETNTTFTNFGVAFGVIGYM